MSKRQWRIEHVARRPRGGRVITKRSGHHLLRVWYPNPQRQANGQLLEILHPRRENPRCIFGERCKKNPEELIILGLASNPHKGETAQAADLYAAFHGQDPRQVLEVQRSAAVRSDYTALGDLDYLVFLPEKNSDGRKIEFSDDDAVKVASNSAGTQLYLIGGNQDLSGCLDEFPVDSSKDLIGLGPLVRISYLARKKFDGFREIAYYHDLGEETGVPPYGYYDKIKREIFIVGGEYRIQPEGIVN